MRIKELTARHFGPFEQWDIQTDAPLVIFFGPNEAGKSTIREMITGLLFGFDKHKATWRPLIHWGASEATLSARLELASGSALSVQRVLGERGIVSLLMRGSAQQEMGNIPLPDVGAITREIYESIYGLTADQLAFPSRTWPQVQDRLLGMEVFENLLPALDVAQALEDEAQAVWRNDNRGKPQARELARQRMALAQDLAEARERQHRLTRIDGLREARHTETERLRAGIRDSEAFLREAELWQQLRARMERVRRLERDAGDLNRFDSLPEDIEAKLRQLEEGITQLEAKLTADRARMEDLGRTCQEYTPEHHRLLDMAEEIDQVSRLTVQYLDDRQELARLNQELTQARDALRQGVLAALEKDPEDLPGLLSRIDINELQKALTALREARAFHAAQSAQAAAPHTAPLPQPRWPGWLTALGSILMAAGLFAGLPLVVPGLPYTLPQPLPWLGAGALAAGVVVLDMGITALVRGRRRRRNTLEQAVEQAAQTVTQARAALALALHSLPLPAQRLDAADEGLPLTVERLQHQSQHIATLTARLRPLQARYDSADNRIARLIFTCMERSPEDVSEDISEIGRRLAQARDARSRHDAAQAEAERLRKNLEMNDSLLERAHKEKEQVLHLLSQADGPDLPAWLSDVSRRRELRRAARAERTALEEDERFAPRLARLAVMEAQWPYDDKIMAETRSYMQTSSQKLEDAGRDLGRLEQEFQSLREQPSPADIQSQLDALARQEADLGLIRDQNALAAAVIRAGRRQFQERHQPDVIRRAGQYLSLITDGRYERLILLEDGTSLRLYSHEAGRYLDPETDRLSRGALAQLYLALRLAVVDNLDPPGEPLPLLLDEVLVDWDDERLGRGLNWLSRFSQGRQVFLFTCHPTLPWMLTQACPGARVYTLTRDKE